MGDAESSSVVSFYKNTNVFITGGTGFLGMALIEKLLRSCPDIGNIYLLIRSKRDKTPSERLQDLTKNPLFERLIQERGPSVFSKLVAVSGNVDDDGLGLSSKDRSMLMDKVNVVFHSAASLDFASSLRSSVQTNLIGTRQVVQLCLEMRNLKAMVHVSSAYVNSDLKHVDEMLYPAKQDADELINLCNSSTAEQLNDLTPKLLEGLPNPYALTKALAEHEAAKAIRHFPVAIVRPSMITTAWKEPIPGWTISKNGPTGFVMGASKGVVRRLPLGMDLIYDCIPVDVVVNELLVVAWHVATERPSSILLFHCTSSTINPFRWSMIYQKLNTFLHDYPLQSAVWYPYVKLLPSMFLFRISSFFIHIIPAHILDTLIKIFGGKPILVRLHTNVNQSLERLETFIFSEWYFNNKQTMALSNSLSPQDQRLFFLDISTLEWEDYFTNLAKGVRRFLHKEDPSTLPAARKKDKILLLLHIALQIGLFSLIWWLSALLIGSKMLTVIWVPILFYCFFCLI